MITYEKYAEIRNSKGLRDADVARAAKIPPSTFTEWKKGEYTPKFDKMCKIADALGMLYLELVDADGNSLSQDKDQLIDKPANPDEQKAMELYRLYQNLTPENRIAFETLLKNLQSDS